MLKSIRSSYHDIDKQALWSMILVVVIGYVVTFLGAFSSDGYGGTAVETILAIVFGVIYLLLGIFDDVYFEQFQGRWATAVYFIIQISLIYAAILFGMFVPLGFRYGNWEAGFYMALSVSPAIFFVVVFTNLSNNERMARRRAEKLMADLEEANHQLSEYAIQAEELATTQERNRFARHQRTGPTARWRVCCKDGYR